MLRDNCFWPAGMLKPRWIRLLKAGVAIRTVYRHFNNKDDLFRAVMQLTCEMTFPELLTAPIRMQIGQLCFRGLGDRLKPPCRLRASII
jgi:AcrR family transcriptional regulator